MDELGMEARKEVLVKSLIVENLVSFFLAKLLGMNSSKDSRVLGNKSGGLSFNQKIDLLIDIQALSSSEKKKFQTFMEIRNQFMHNISASSYEKCLSFTDKTNFLLKEYPRDDRYTIEEKIKTAVNSLGWDIIDSTMKLMDKANIKIQNDKKIRVLEELLTKRTN